MITQYADFFAVVVRHGLQAPRVELVHVAFVDEGEYLLLNQELLTQVLPRLQANLAVNVMPSAAINYPRLPAFWKRWGGRDGRARPGEARSFA